MDESGMIQEILNVCDPEDVFNAIESVAMVMYNKTGITTPYDPEIRNANRVWQEIISICTEACNRLQKVKEKHPVKCVRSY